MFRKVHRPSPAMVVALLALFVALGGSAVAAGIVPHAKYADKAGVAAKATLAARATLATNALNAAKLQGKTAAEVAAMIPPTSSVAGLITVKTGTWTLQPRQEQNFTTTCDAGQKAISGGWSDPGDYASGYQSLPTADGSGWTINLYMTSVAPGPQTGTTYAICLK